MDAAALFNELVENDVYVKQNEPLACHTTWRIGGVADLFISPHSVAELERALRLVHGYGVPVTVLGRGSNTLVLDGGVRGLVVQLHDGLAEIRVEGNQLIAQAGRSFVSAAAISVKHGLTGLEFASGIPGTVGGAVMMNAGAHGGEVRDALTYAHIMDLDGHVHCLTNAQLQFGYRTSWLKEHSGIVVDAAFDLAPGQRDESLQRMRLWSLRRSTTQPLSLPNCGSVFRNPEGTHAARLIEEVGLKGMRRGNAQISDKHANFIVNLGGALAVDVLWLMHHVQETVQAQCNIALETEVRVVGEPASGR